ncbi:hypothetical protein EPICR_20263 [Candidatus Desulfarcum epimagneticum]|uniref:Uncharacterized protein n=1 Tax=uncultured Desulfobacteraceae bacterium TaxID=218296 RepID=A0A484HJN2_9BACT|nr:hypothetical protein EPICR_20263 [uncultured Desulfobacteraceae bacterium]
MQAIIQILNTLKKYGIEYLSRQFNKAIHKIIYKLLSIAAYDVEATIDRLAGR